MVTPKYAPLTIGSMVGYVLDIPIVRPIFMWRSAVDHIEVLPLQEAFQRAVLPHVGNGADQHPEAVPKRVERRGRPRGSRNKEPRKQRAPGEAKLIATAKLYLFNARQYEARAAQAAGSPDAAELLLARARKYVASARQFEEQAAQIRQR